MSSSILVTAILFFSCCVMFAYATSASSSSSGGSRYNAIFNFGDSTSDTGNMCPDGRPSTGGISFFSHRPYGITYFGKPTCRCCDGRVVVDFLAQAFGLPFLPPSKAHGKDFRRGANMAVGGGTVLGYTILQLLGYDKSVNASMRAQIENFQRLLPSICGTRENCKDYMAKSLFVFELGENDYNNVLMVNGSTIDEASKNIPKVVRGITSGLEELITLGAVDIVVSNIAPIGCFPMYLNLFKSSSESDYDEYGCLRNYNAVFNKHNSFLKSSLSRLQKKHQHTRIMHADLAGHFYQMVQNPEKFGFKTTLTSCCGEALAPYMFSFLALCGVEGTSVCRDPSSHLIWDGMHTSDAANKRVADGWLNGPYCHPPILQ